ncbi:MAG TPA: hypothetical protein VM261_11585 [Kofleriaceae bacterium]|nr:hypothetical protein [Kofleriaceae bacterium]
MELTGLRRFIHTTLFATVAWAGYLLLFTWSWRGGDASGFHNGEPPWFGSGGFPAGNGASIVLGFAAVAFAAFALRRPTLEHARVASALLLMLVPAALVEIGMSQLIVEGRLPDNVRYEPTGMAVRAAAALIAASGVVLLAATRALVKWEQKARPHRTFAS